MISLSTSMNILEHIPQMETCVVTCFDMRSVCVAALFLLGARSSGEAEDTAFFARWLSCCLLLRACPLGHIYAHPLQSAGLMVFTCLNLLPLAVSSSQWVQAQLLREHPLFSQVSPCPHVPLVSPTTTCYLLLPLLVLLA